MAKTLNLSNILTALGYLPNTIRIYTDWNTALAEWKRIDGFNASTGVLMNFLGNYTLHLVEYATWTKITWDDQVAQAIKFILIDHRETVIQIIELVRQGKEPDATALTQIASSVGITEKAGSPMTVLYVLSMIYQVLQHLKSLQTNNTNNTDEDSAAIETNRPVLAFVRKIFDKK